MGEKGAGRISDAVEHPRKTEWRTHRKRTLIHRETRHFRRGCGGAEWRHHSSRENSNGDESEGGCGGCDRCVIAGRREDMWCTEGGFVPQNRCAGRAHSPQGMTEMPEWPYLLSSCLSNPLLKSCGSLRLEHMQDLEQSLCHLSDAHLATPQNAGS